MFYSYLNINKTLNCRCNKTKECSDGSDEENCVRDCKEDEVKCKEEEICIPKR